MIRVLVAAASVAAALAVPASAAGAAGCPEGWYPRPTGYTNPVTGRAITYCWPLT